MWDGLPMLLLLCIVMAVASFLAGMLPLYFSLSSRQLRLITALGTGVLVGTSLIVIIPEGIETLYSASGSSHSHDTRSIGAIRSRGVLDGAAFHTLPEHHVWRREEITAIPGDVGGVDDNGLDHIDTDPDGGFNIAEATALDDGTDPQNDGTGHREIDEPDDDDDDDEDEDDDDTSHNPHAWVGISLITGFILMYLIDTLPRHATRTSQQPQRFAISLNNLSFNRIRSSFSNSAADDEPPPTPSHSHSPSSRPSSTTVGLVIHALSDGIALGASSTTTSRLSFIIFLALMIHKAPAAFGLTSVLLKQGLSKRAARAHLIVFALAAPAGALLTWAAAHLLGYSSAAVAGSMSAEFATGVLLLFSGGTFLYVAMHTMQEGAGAHEHGAGETNGYASVPMSDMYDASTPAAPKQDSGTLTDTLVTVVGMLVPLLTQVGGHGH